MSLKDYQMRRKDRQMDQDFAYYVIDKADYGVLSVKDQDSIYSLPLSIVRQGDTLYFHSAKAGRKVDLYKDGTYVSIVFVTDVQVPENYDQDELDQIFSDTDKASKHVSSVFTTEFASALVEGRLNKVEDDPGKIHGLELICEKYTPTKMDYFQTAIKVSLDRVNIYKVDILEMTSKRKKYNQNAVEMKFMRRD